MAEVVQNKIIVYEKYFGKLSDLQERVKFVVVNNYFKIKKLL